MGIAEWSGLASILLGALWAVSAFVAKGALARLDRHDEKLAEHGQGIAVLKQGQGTTDAALTDIKGGMRRIEDDVKAIRSSVDRRHEQRGE